MSDSDYSTVSQLVQANGFSVARGFFSGKEMQYTNGGYGKLLDKLRTSGKIDSCNSLDWAMVPEEKVEYLFSKDQLCRLQRLGAMLLGTDVDHTALGVRVFNKAPGAAPTPLHQDKAYELGTQKGRVSIWMSLDEVSENNGALYYLKGSHKINVVSHTENFINGVKYLRIDEDVSQYEKIVAFSGPGDIVVHNDLVLHGAFPNKTKNARRAIVIIVRASEASV